VGYEDVDVDSLQWNKKNL